MLSPGTQAIVTTAAAFAPDTVKHVATTVSNGVSDALPGVLQGIGVILSGFGIRRAIAANGNNK